MKELKLRAFRKYPKSEMYYFTLDDLVFNTFNKQPLIDYSGVRENTERCIDLRDKKGKDIYEGDIVRLGDANLIVIYQAPSFVMKHKPKAKTWNEFILESSQNQFCEVIGNIHENPELIK